MFDVDTHCADYEGEAETVRSRETCAAVGGDKNDGACADGASEPEGDVCERDEGATEERHISDGRGLSGDERPRREVLWPHPRLEEVQYFFERTAC